MALFKPGPFASTVRGKTANMVLAQTESGIVIRDHVIPKNPRTAAQVDLREDFAKATRTWETLSAARVISWNNYGEDQTRRTKAGKVRTKNGFNVFTGLATKFLQVNPNGNIPLDPPSAPFSGDSVTLTATAGTGKITFTADKANAAGVTTEFLFQRLRNLNRRPQSAYKTLAFNAFTSGSLSKDVTIPTGFYAVGYRFVKTSTGQESLMTRLPLQTVQFAVEGGSTQRKKAA